MNIGSIIKARRVQLGFSQQALAALIGVSFQQVQKYENNKSELTVSRLAQFASALQLPLSAFFADDIEQNTSNREVLELIKAFNGISDYQTRKKLADLARAIAELA